jgi:RNA polymerase sigma-70 factor (ECF subfamily)
METSVSLLERLAGTPTDDDWRRLLDLYQPLLRAWMARAGVAASDADDLIQEVLLVVFREVAAFEHRRPGAFRAWLRTILANRIRTYFRDRQRAPQAPGGSEFLERLAELEAADSELSEQWDREHDQFVAGQAMQRVRGDFSPTTWEAFNRYVLNGVPAAQVAQELELTLNAVLLARGRVLKRLRHELGGLVE